MRVSMRHSISVGGRFFPPPKYCSYSIFSCRMSFSSCPRSSSTVLAMGFGSHHYYAKWLKLEASTHTPGRGAEQVMFPGHCWMNEFTVDPYPAAPCAISGASQKDPDSLQGLRWRG